DDVHVLAAAVAGGAGALLTANTRDFPLRVMAAVGILRRHPDEFLLEIGLSAPEVLRPLIAAHHEAVGSGRSPRTFLRRSGLARLGKWYAP
ncbi:MAG: PIN domain-containing protein, partial [Pseudomonadota bacterium]